MPATQALRSADRLGCSRGVYLVEIEEAEKDRGLEVSRMDELVRRLLNEQNECTLSWLTREGLPASTVVSFVLLDGLIAMTALEHSARVTAIRRNPNVALVVSGSGSPVGHSRCVSIQGECEIRGDQETRDRFFPIFSASVLPDSRRGAEMMAKGMNSPENQVLLVTPRKLISYDAQASLDRANKS